MSASIETLAEHLAANLRRQRTERGYTQARLASLAGIPRSTLANIEVGGGNPTLAVLGGLAYALHLTIEELLAAPRARFRVYRHGALPVEVRDGAGRTEVAKLLPDPVPGMEIDRLRIRPGGRIAGVPHAPGTREYLYCERGQLTLWAAGERVDLRAGDLVAFPGDQAHAYGNTGERIAVGFGVVTRIEAGS
jgi:transcriptional regulator with XRE-family HTH domain